MALRSQDPLPEWITHVAYVDGLYLRTQRRGDGASQPHLPRERVEALDTVIEESGKELVSMKDANVKYSDRHVRLFYDYYHP